MPRGIVNGRGNRWRHGMTRTRVHKAWSEMKQRCLNPYNDKWKWYGGRGIKVCDRWFLFENFLADMGEPPPAHTLDRVDVNGNYEPGNCRWAGKTTQMNNMRSNVMVEIDGVEMTLTEAAKKHGVRPGTAWRRINLGGWDVERAIKTPSRGWRRP